MMDSQLNRKTNKTCKNGLPKKIRIEQYRWEYDQICKSLSDCRCDDAINILLTDTKELPSSETIPFAESLPTEPHHRHDQQQRQQKQRWQQQKQQLNEQMNASSNAVMLPPAPKSMTKHRPTPLQPISTVCSKRDSVIMNLDKNRINVKRNKLLPRPLSLPNGLKLFRNTSVEHHHHQTSVNEMYSEKKKIDLDFIKQLEDDIYRTKNELYIECKEKRVPKQLPTKTCYECNQVISTPSFAPNQITDRKMIEFKLSHFNKRQNAVLLLDAWQLQPMTMLRENNELFNFFCGYPNEREKFENKQYVVIVDNSSFYPVFMSYEIGKQKYDFSTESNKPVTCECIDSDAYTRDFTRIFQNNVKQLAGQIQKAMPNISADEIDSSVMHRTPANNNKSNEIYPSIVHNSSRLLPPTQKQQQKPLSALNSIKNEAIGIKTKKTRFENLLKIYSHPSLKIFMRKKKTKNQHTADDVKPAPIPTPVSLPLPLMPTKVINPEQILNSKSLKVKQIFTQRNQKLHWLLHTKPKIEQFKLRLRQRPRSHSATTSDEMLRKNKIKTEINRSAAFCDSNQMLTTTLPNDYANAFRQLFRRISWSCSDLLDINRAVNLRILYLNRDENVEHPLNKTTTNHQVHRNLCDTPAITNKKRKSDRSVSLRRSKRYSVGSNSTMTDTVKAWVYRRRC